MKAAVDSEQLTEDSEAVVSGGLVVAAQEEEIGHGDTGSTGELSVPELYNEDASMASAREVALELVLSAVGSEVREAMGKHARFNSAHEGYAVILEELDELKAEVWKKREARDKARMQEEAVQVAAMAVRFVLDVI